jgi:hypothetical protein
MSAVYLLKATGVAPFNYLSIYNIEGRSGLQKVYKLRPDSLFMFCKNLRDENESKNDLAEILYVNNGGSLCDGFLKYTDMKRSGSIFKKGSKIYFKKLTKQMNSLEPSGIVFNRKDIEILLSNTGEKNYNTCFDVIVNRLIGDIQKKKKDYEKLYSYWRENCYSNYNFYRIDQGDLFVDLRVDYARIKKSKKKLHKELMRMFALFKM